MNFMTEEFQSTANHVREQKRTKITNVSEVINRRPAAVHSHAVRFHGLKGLGRVGERVVKLDIHRSVSVGKRVRVAGRTANGRVLARG